MPMVYGQLYREIHRDIDERIFTIAAMAENERVIEEPGYDTQCLDCLNKIRERNWSKYITTRDEKSKVLRNKKQIEGRDKLEKRYVAHLLKMKAPHVPEDLYRLKKEQILLFRETKKLNKLIKNIKEESK